MIDILKKHGVNAILILCLLYTSTLLTPEQVVGETYLLLENAMPKKSCVFRSNHASNYISLRGNLPEDRQRMLAQLKVAMENTGLLKDERFRML